MRKVLVLSLLLNAVLLGSRDWREVLASAGGPADARAEIAAPVSTTINGDANGDGLLDISDPIQILFHLFGDAPAPVPLECPTAAPRLARTGQTRCFDDLGAEILCNSDDFPGQDAFYRNGCDVADRFVDNGDATITDLCTGLMWSRSTQDIAGDGDFDKALVDWQTALTFCENHDLAGHTDWRLPNVRELMSIGQYIEDNPPVDEAFTLLAPRLYWTSTTDLLSPRNAWLVAFDFGGAIPESTDKRSSRIFVLCVRDAD